MTEDHMESRPRRGFFGAFRHPTPSGEESASESEHEVVPDESGDVDGEHGEHGAIGATSPASQPETSSPTPPLDEFEALLDSGSAARPTAGVAAPGPDGAPTAAADPPVAPAPPVVEVPLATVTAAEVEAEPDPAPAPDPDAFVGTAPPPRAVPERPVPKLQGEPERELASRDAAPPLELPRVIALANQKGGVGKTTTAVNLGAGLAELGYRVLVVDLDPQGNATTGLGINPRDVEASIYDVIMSGVSPEDCIEPTSLKNLFVLPATIDLAGAEIELVPAFSRELKLKRALDSIKHDYDVILIDCPPSLGLLTINGLAAADDVIVPIQCEYYALEGLGQLLRNVSLVRSGLNPTLDVRGIVLTMYDARTKLADQVETEVRTHFGAKVYRTIVPRTVRLGEAPSFGQPIIVFDPSSRGATAYRDLAKEVSGGATRRSG